MILKEDIDRINFLYKKSKDGELSDEERAEQQRLRSKYIEWIKTQVKGQIEAHVSHEKN